MLLTLKFMVIDTIPFFFLLLAFIFIVEALMVTGFQKEKPEVWSSFGVQESMLSLYYLLGGSGY